MVIAPTIPTERSASYAVDRSERCCKRSTSSILIAIGIILGIGLMLSSLAYSDGSRGYAITIVGGGFITLISFLALCYKLHTPRDLVAHVIEPRRALEEIAIRRYLQPDCVFYIKNLPNFFTVIPHNESITIDFSNSVFPPRIADVRRILSRLTVRSVAYIVGEGTNYQPGYIVSAENENVPPQLIVDQFNTYARHLKIEDDRLPLMKDRIIIELVVSYAADDKENGLAANITRLFAQQGIYVRVIAREGFINIQRTLDRPFRGNNEYMFYINYEGRVSYRLLSSPHLLHQELDPDDVKLSIPGHSLEDTKIGTPSPSIQLTSISSSES